MKKLGFFVISLCLIVSILVPQSYGQPGKDNKPKSKELDEILSTLTNTISIIERHNVVYDRQNVFSNAVSHFIRLFDDRAQILTQEEANKLKEYQNGICYGTGIKIRMKNGLPLVLEVPTNSSAAKAGIKGENVIVAIDGTPTLNLSIDEVNNMLRSNSPKEIALDIKQNLRSTETNNIRLKLESMQMVPAISEEWNHDINYVKINNLFPGSGVAISAVIRKWLENSNSCSGIIMDMRGTEGVDVMSVVEIANFFPSKSKILFSICSADGTEQASYQHKLEKTINVPVIVLIDKNTRGTAELLVALLAKTRGVMLLGENTAGDNKVRSFVPFQNGNQLYIATAEFVLNKNDKSYAGVGIKPHVTMKMDKTSPKEKDNTTPPISKPSSDSMDIFSNLSPETKLDTALIDRVQADPPLRRAVDILLGLKALNITMQGN